MTRKRVILRFLVAFFSCTAFAQEWFDMPLWPENDTEKKDAVIRVYLPENPGGASAVIHPAFRILLYPVISMHPETTHSGFLSLTGKKETAYKQKTAYNISFY